MNGQIKHIKETLEKLIEKLEEKMIELENNAYNRSSGKMTEAEQLEYEKYENNKDTLERVLEEIDYWEE